MEDNLPNLEQELTLERDTKNFNYKPSENLIKLFERTKFELDDFNPIKNKVDVISKIYNKWLTKGNPSYNKTYKETITPMIELLKENPGKFLDDDNPNELLENLKKRIGNTNNTLNENDILLEILRKRFQGNSIDLFLAERKTLKKNLEEIYNNLSQIIVLEKQFQMKEEARKIKMKTSAWGEDSTTSKKNVEPINDIFKKNKEYLMDLIQTLIGVPEELSNPDVLNNWKRIIESEKKYTLNNINNNKKIKASDTNQLVLHKSQFTKEDEERMEKIIQDEEEQYNKQLKEMNEENPDFDHKDLHRRPSTTRTLEDGNTIVGQKYGDVQVVDESDKELEIEDRETIQYRHRTFKDKSGKEIAAETIPRKIVTTAMERKLRAMSIKDINNYMLGEMDNDKSYKIGKVIEGGIFKYQHMKTASFECINIIDTTNNDDMYGKTLLEKIGTNSDMKEFTTKVNNLNPSPSQQMQIPKVRIYLTYLEEDMGTPIKYDDNLDDKYYWRVYPINPINQSGKRLNYTEHPLFYVKIKKEENEFIFDDDNSTVISEKEYMEQLIKQFVPKSYDEENNGPHFIESFLSSLGMGIILDSWDNFCKTLDQDSCKLYSFCAVIDDKCGLGKIDNLQGNNPYLGVSDKKNLLKIPNVEKIQNAWKTFKVCNESNGDITDVFKFDEFNGLWYYGIDKLIGVIDEYRAKIKYLSKVRIYLEKMKTTINVTGVGTEVEEILKEINMVEYKTINDIIALGVSKLKIDITTNIEENALTPIKNIYDLLDNYNVKDKKKIIIDELQRIFQLQKIKTYEGIVQKNIEKIRNKFRLKNYEDWPDIIEKYDSNNKLMRMLQLEKERLKKKKKEEEKLIKKLGERTKNLISEWKKWQNEKSSTLKQYNDLYYNNIKIIKRKKKVLNTALETLKKMDDLNEKTLGDDITFIGKNAFKEEKKQIMSNNISLNQHLNDLEGKLFDNNKIKAEEEKEDEIAIEDKKQARTYDSIQKFNDAIDKAQKKHKTIKSILVNKISAIEDEISSPEITFDDVKKVYKIRKKEKEEKSINEILAVKIAKEISDDVLEKYKKAFKEEMNDLDDYVIVPDTYNQKFYKIGGDIKKVLKKNNNGDYYGPNKESYDNDVKEINKLISMLQDEIKRETKKRNPKDKADEAFLRMLSDDLKYMNQTLTSKKIKDMETKVKDMETKVKVNKMFNSNNVETNNSSMLNKKGKRKGPFTIQKILNKMQTFYLNKSNVSFVNMPNGRNPDTLHTLLATIDVKTASETLQSINMTKPYKTRKYTEVGGIVQAWGNKEMIAPEKLYYTQMLIRNIYHEFEKSDFKIKLKKKK